jgi:hypothetical protein
VGIGKPVVSPIQANKKYECARYFVIFFTVEVLDETEPNRRRANVALKRACLAKVFGDEFDRWSS